MKKFERIDILKSLISNNEIARQEDLVRLFKERGFAITQATISRDIKNLAVTKIQTSSGRYKYVIPENSAAMANQVNHFIHRVEKQLNLVRLDVRPGSSMRVKNDIQIRFSNWVFAVIADDDSVLIFAKSNISANMIYKELVNK